MVSSAPRELVAPLVQSLRHQMTARDDTLFRLAGRTPEALDETLRRALADRKRENPKAFHGPPKKARKLARSVQRMRVPRGRDAAWAIEDHLHFLPRLFRGGIRVRIEEDGKLCRFRCLGFDLLVLRYEPEGRDAARQILWVVGGLLSGRDQQGRLEFRLLPDGETLLTAVHDFHPSLPWPVYRLTQALAHAFVMGAYGRSLLTSRA